MKEGDLIKSTNNLNNDDLKLLREKFISEYTKKKYHNLVLDVFQLGNRMLHICNYQVC